MRELRANELLDFDVPTKVQSLTPFDTALYALSVGFAQEPSDDAERAFVDPTVDMPVTPSMALVLGYPGFWLGLPETGVDAARVIHAEQHVELFAPLPSHGQIIGETHVTSLESRGEGRGLAMTSVRDISVVDGDLVARVTQTHFLLGNSAVAPEQPRRDKQAPLPRDPDHIVELTTRPEQALLYRLNGDLNPLHSDPRIAAKAGFDKPILHGMCTFGVANRAVLKAVLNYEAPRLARIGMQFRAPVFPGDTLVTEIWNEGLFRVVAQNRKTVVADSGRFECRSAKPRDNNGNAGEERAWISD